MYFFKKALQYSVLHLGPSQTSRNELEAVAQTCSVKKVFLEISQNLQESICARVSFSIKLQAWTTFLIEHL